MNITQKLFDLRDDKYRAFHARLIPNISKDRIIGVRVPELRVLSKEFMKTSGANTFLDALPHNYYEENNIHAFMIEQIKDFDEALYRTKEFLPYIDNWATCDSFMPKVFRKYPDELISEVLGWIKSDHTYTARYGIGMLMKIFLKENFSSEYVKLVSEIRSEEYYINMMIAWYFATALVYRYEFVIPYITERRLDRHVHNKAIQKAVESRRINEEMKQYLKGFRI